MKFLNYFTRKTLVVTCMLFALITGFNLKAQEIKCGADKEMKTFYEKNSNAKKEHSALLEKLSLAQRAGGFASKADSYVVPVVFHIFGTEFNNGTTVNDQIVKEALKFTNDEFQGLDPAWSTIDAPFNAIKQKLDITFKLAQLDPNGNPTTGIIYYDEKGGMGNYSDPTVAAVGWDNYKYCNIYITRDLYDNGDFYESGVAWYPTTGMSDQDIARIVFNGSFLAGNAAIANPNRPYFRSILTHEFGHWLDLPHTFDKGVCNNDPNDGDGVADTPSHKSPSSNANCTVIQNCLGQEINNENFMDYTSCYKMFTQGQVARMVNALDNAPSRNTLWTTANLNATGVNTNLGARIAISGAIFEERFNNDGQIGNSIDISCVDCTFTKSSGQMTLNSDYTVANVPAGLSPRIVVNSNTSATIHLDNTASSHEALNSISNLSITFLNPSVSGGVSGLYKSTLDKLKVTFKDKYTKFCDLGIRFATYAHITNVEFNGLSNASGYDNNGNSNYLDIEYPIKKGETYPLSITTNTGNAQAQGTDPNRIQVWFDWNGDFILDANELVASHPYTNTSTDTAGNYTYTTNVTVPNNAKLGKIGFRAMVHYVQNNEGDDPCGTVDSGEAEDYGLNVLDDSVGFEVNFSGNPTEVNFSEQVTFIDLSTTETGDSVASRKWTFEGGTPATSTSSNPKVLFRNPGKFNVTLQVTTASGQTKTVTKTEYITSKLEYCDISPRFGSYFSVNKVVLNTINHAPGKSQGISYYDTVGTTLEIGKSYPMTITAELGNGGQGDVNRVRVWADWNFDSVFSDNELVFSKVVNFADYDSNKEITFTESITVPASAASGKKIGLRVLGHYVKGTEGDSACGSIDSGNRADYGITISGVSTPTCNDGIQNGDETGIDCGGSCDPCIPDPTCDDGIQNGDETGIDCGGSCGPCIIAVDGAMVSTSDNQTEITTITGDGIADVITFKNTSQSIATYGYLITDEAGKILASETGSHDFEGAAAGICKVYGISYNGSLSVTGKSITDRDLATASYDVSDNFITVTRKDPEPDPTCTDGIQNGDETGIDCGGTSCPACPTITYCEAKASNSSDEYISRFQLGSIDNTSTSNGGYSDFTTESTSLTKDASATLTITPTWASTVYDEAYGVWIDYNQDGDFEDAGEQVFSKAASRDTSISGQFTVPSTAKDGTTRLRVIMRYSTSPSPCGTFNYGEVEDYTVSIGGVVIPDPTCTDGIQNGDETGIDCGGSCAPCDTSGTVIYVDIDDKVASAASAWNFFRIETGDNKDYGAWFSGNTLYLVTYNKDVVCVGSTNNIQLLADGVEVGASSNFVANSHSFVVSSSSYTDSNGKSGYIGFTFKIDNQVHYGWFYVTVANDGLSYTILDYAYNTTAGQSLVTTRNTTKSQNKVKKTSVFPNPFTNNLTVDVSGLGNERFTMTVYNVLGKVVYQKVYADNPKTITLGEKEISRTGNYFIKFVSGSRTEVNTVIKQ